MLTQFVSLLIFCATAIAQKGAKESFHQYCVIGAGPAGLQMGYFLKSSNRDYIIYEKGSMSGTFYQTYPIHRMLISINKRFTGKTNKEFNFRHDWNSLISDDESLRMTNYSKEFFPHADVLVKYLNDYTTKLKLNVQYNTKVKNLRKREEDGIFEMNDENNSFYTCQYVVVATGIATPNIIKTNGSELMEGYEDQTLNVDDYEGQSVLIIGRGNAAYEVAQHILPATNYVHMMSRSRVKLAWTTHYVGDLRAVNDGILDTYQLKSLDGILDGDVTQINVVKSKLDGRLYITENHNDSSPGGAHRRVLDNSPPREGYDRIIRCLGFKFDDSIFHSDMPIRHCKGRKQKYPFIRYNYEAVDVPNLFFAGANSHSLDYRKSAGAFIHGYRYTTRTLHRILEWTKHGVKWPSVHFDNILDLIPHILKRVNEASDIYQMFGVLCEFVIFNENMTQATYLEAFPCAMGNRIFSLSGHNPKGAIMIVAMEYGKNFSGLDKDPFHEDRSSEATIESHRSNFLHPVFYHYNTPFTHESFIEKPSNFIIPVPDRIHHMLEDFTTKFDAQATHILNLRRFIESCTGQDLRFFYADQCMKLAMTRKTLPLGCRQYQGQPGPSNMITKPEELGKVLTNFPNHFLPLETL